VGLRENRAVDHRVGNRREEIRGVGHRGNREEDLQEGTQEGIQGVDHLESQEEDHRVGNRREENLVEHRDRQESQVEDRQTGTLEGALVAA